MNLFCCSKHCITFRLCPSKLLTEALFFKTSIFLGSKEHNVEKEREREMAAFSCSWATLPSKMRNHSLTSCSSSSISNPCYPCFSRNLSHTLFCQGTLFRLFSVLSINPFHLIEPIFFHIFNRYAQDFILLEFSNLGLCWVLFHSHVP